MMDKTRNLLLIFFSHCLYLFIHATFATSPPKEWVDTLPFFKDPENRDLHTVVVDLEGNVYVGGNNVLHRFSPDLELKETVTTGPLMDNAQCFHPSLPCSKKRVPTDNINHVLQMLYHLGPRPSLLLCGTVYRRLCQVRPVDNLTEYQWVHPFDQRLGYTGGPYSTRAFFASGYNDQLTLFTASTDHEPFGLRKNNAPFITSKVIEKDEDRYYFRYAFQNATAKSAVEFSGRAERTVMGGGFVYDGFAYFLIKEELISYGVKTSLVRVCTQDGTFNSYSELLIVCDHTAGQLKEALAAHMGDSPFSDGKSLYVTFTRVEWGNAGTALCIFPMNEVVHAFTHFPRNCVTTVGRSCRKMKNDVTDFCGPDVSPYNVSKPLVVPYLNFSSFTSFTAVTTVRNNNVVVAIIGQSNGLIKKMSLSSGEVISFNDMLDLNTTGPIRAPFVFDRDHKYIYALVNNKIVKYPVATCEVHSTCESCLAGGGTIDPLKCGWCAGRCAHLQECTNPGSFSRDTCTPSILQVSPLKGPIQGSVKIKITGDSLGTYVDDVHNSITVAGIPCEVLDWQNREVTCTLRPAPKVTSGPVELHVIMPFSSAIGYSVVGSSTSYHNFSYYVGPKLYGIRPGKGPTSGGTHVTMFGENLDFEKSQRRYFIVRGRLCELREFNETSAKCITENVTRPDYPDKIAIVVGNVTYVMGENPPSTFDHPDVAQSFEYIPDPEIHLLQPGFTTVSGLMNVTVTGLYLDSVLSPKIVVQVTISKLKKLEFPEACWSDPESRGTTLTCSTPSLVGQPWVPIPTRMSPLLTHVSFIMDGIQWVKEFPQHQKYMSRLLYYPDPEFRTFKEIEKIVDDQTAIEIKGKHLDLLHSANNFQIKLGEQESCKITSVSTELLVCDLPPTLKNSSVIGTNISVEVFMGSTSRHLGYIEIMPLKKNHMSWGLLAIGVLTLFAVIGVTFLCFRKFRKKKPLLNVHNIAVSNRTEYPNDYHLVQTRDSPATNHQCQISSMSSIPDATVTRNATATRTTDVPATGTTDATATGTTDAIATLTTDATATLTTDATAAFTTDATAALTTDATAAALEGATATAITDATATAMTNTTAIVVTDATATELTDVTSNSEKYFDTLQFIDRKMMRSLEAKGLVIQKTELTIRELIGRGHFGQVFKGTLQRQNEKVIEIAVKTLHQHVWSNPIEAENFMKEALKMKDFDDPHVLGLLGIYFEGRVPNIVLPFMENGDVYNYIKHQKKDLQVSDLVKFAVDIASGMCYLSKLTFIHRDLATRNCVLDSNKVAKVADFGMSRNMYGGNYYRTRDKAAELPFRWMAPEAIDPGIYSIKSDVWSYGVVLWELMTRGSIPYANVGHNWDVLPYIKLGNRLDRPQYCPKALYFGMLSCWNTDPNRRPNFFELHKYVCVVHKKLVGRAPTTLAAVTENTMYCNVNVPAQNTNYFNSKELYLRMDGCGLNEDIL